MHGAYAARPLWRPLLLEGVIVISHLRRDPKLFDLPPERPGRRGRRRIYGENRIHLAKRAARKAVCRRLMATCRVPKRLATERQSWRRRGWREE